MSQVHANRRPIHFFSRTDEQRRKIQDNHERDIQGFEYVLKGGTPEELAKKLGFSDEHTKKVLMRVANRLYARCLKEDTPLPRPTNFNSIAKHRELWLEKFGAHCAAMMQTSV